jgi:predicted SPOUT superfamily RNA methylase MTH1
MKRRREEPTQGKQRPEERVQGSKRNTHTTAAQDNATSSWALKLHPNTLDTSSRPVSHTVTLAIPGSILRGAQTRELRSALVGQIARAAAVHEIDEIVVFVDSAYEASAPDLDKTPSVICCRLLQYLECPAYLRKALFPVHADLSFAGALPSLDTPHHMRREDVSLYREGVVVDNKVSEDGVYVNIGLSTEAFLARHIKPGVRVTLELDEPEVGTDVIGNAQRGTGSMAGKKIPTGIAVAPNKPRAKHGLYWGYQTRLARTFGEIFSGCLYKGGYDLIIGHSLNGQSIDSLATNYPCPEVKPKHFLVVFGGQVGIEGCVDADETLSTPGRDAETLFDVWANMCPTSGSKAVRTEELVMTGLASLRPLVKRLCYVE